MNFRGFEISAQRNIRRSAVDIWLVKYEAGSVTFLETIILKTLPREDGVAVLEKEGADFFSLPYDLTQNLMDELWRCGFRPTEGTGSAGSLKATENHLADMQKLSWRLLDMVEKDK